LYIFFLIFAVRKEKRKIISRQYTEIQKRLDYVLHYRSIVARFPWEGGGVNWQGCEADRYIHLLLRLEIREVILLLRHIPSENGKVKILYWRTRWRHTRGMEV